MIKNLGVEESIKGKARKDDRKPLRICNFIFELSRF